jgi:hypothetical protein
MRRTMISLVLVTLLAACGTAGQRPVTTPPASIGSDLPPIGTGIEGLHAYGQEHADEYGGLYVDPPGGQHVVILFTANLDEHARAVEAIHPGTTVRGVEHTEAELLAILEGIDHEALLADGIEMLSAGLDTINNRVFLEAKSNDPTAELRLELAFAGLVEVTIHAFPGDWENLAAGNGWRLLGAGLGTMEPYTVMAATDADAYAGLWASSGLDGPAPEVAPGDELVVAFGHGISLSCPEVRLDEVWIGDGLVWSVTSDPLDPRNCELDLSGTHVFVVALERSAVPADGFRLWLDEYSAGRNGGFSAPVDVELP